MKKKYIILLILMAMSTMLLATDPWGEPEILYSSMTVMAQVSINGSPAVTGDVLGAFVSIDGADNLRGKADVMVVDGVAGCLLMIFTETNAEELHFRVWDASLQAQYGADQTLLSEVDAIVGEYPNNLYQINGSNLILTLDPWEQPMVLPGSMSLMAKVNINDVPATTDDILAAFVMVDSEEQLRGKAPLHVIGEVPGCLLQIFTISAGEEIHFKVWDYSAQQIRSCNNILFSEPDGNVGDYPDNMYFINPGGAIQQIQKPNISPPAGEYSLSPQIFISCDLPAATIRYSLDGSSPTATSAEFVSPFVLPQGVTTTVKAKAFSDGWFPSMIRSVTYQVNGPAATPVFTPAQGIYTSPRAVSIACSTPLALIRYTTNGSNPTETSDLYVSPIHLPSHSSTTIKAWAYLVNWEPSSIATASYVITGTVAKPTFTPSGGAFLDPVLVSMNCSSAGAQIRYTIDGSEPDSASILYNTPLLISSTCTLKARAFLEDWQTSDTAMVVYTIGENVAVPSFAPEPGGHYTNSIDVQIFCATNMAQIYYTLDGSVPTEGSTLYSAPITISDSTLVSARGYYLDYTPSAVATALYTFTVSNPTDYQLPELGGIKAAYPNPFQDKLNISLQVKDSYQDYKLKIYNVKGACVHTRHGIAKGSFELIWNGRDAQGSKLPSGIYLLHFSTKDQQTIRRVILY
ncbi:MAG: chitobiase/beta-hexosaminidase C-terminal domain-containing protein [Candidatus Cloacimonetes bacterium]|nr:chitobiase/beta-hexosaminidase C-terminal domain-containing protein [Candidatus Cloacimonadota bacterium]